MRLVTTLLLWLVTTVALTVAVPAAWAQRNIVDPNGYAAFAASAAKDPRLQHAVAAELTTQVGSLLSQHGYHANVDLIRGIASAYTVSPSFPGQFAVANQIVHQWLFADTVQDSAGRWVIDLAPMLADTSFQQAMDTFGVEVPQTLTVPVTVTESSGLRPGQLRPVARWGPWVSVGAAILTGVLALLTLAAARARGKALAALGVSALLAGGVGWAAPEVARRYLNEALNHTTGDIRQIADAMVSHAIGSLHQWLNLTLAAGIALVVFGVFVTMAASLRRKS